jgi:hypothetical protein
MSSLSLRQIALACALVCAPLFAAAQMLPTVTLKGHRFSIEVAQDDPSRERGLMYREHMEDNHGMLFVFEQETPQAFWMKNTKIPLDMLFFDHAGKLVAIQAQAQPCKADPCKVYPSNEPALYVLELNGGMAARIGVKPGDILEIHR